MTGNINSSFFMLELSSNNIIQFNNSKSYLLMIFTCLMKVEQVLKCRTRQHCCIFCNILEIITLFVTGVFICFCKCSADSIFHNFQSFLNGLEIEPNLSKCFFIKSFIKFFILLQNLQSLSTFFIFFSQICQFCKFSFY